MKTMELCNIKEHPKNVSIYGEFDPTTEENQALIKSIKDYGLLEPLVVSLDGTLLSGHRRFNALKAVGAKEAQVIIKAVNEDQYLTEFNLYRHKTPQQIYNEICFLFNIYKNFDVIPSLLGVSKGNAIRYKKVFDSEAKGGIYKSLVEALRKDSKTLSQAYKRVIKQENLDKMREAAALKIKPNITGACRHGDFREVLSDLPDGSIDAIITDPPYPGEYLPLFGELMAFASKKLRPGGWLATMSGTVHLPKVFNLLESNKGKEMRYFWTLAVTYEGNEFQMVQTVNAKSQWKPFILYRKDFEGSQLKFGKEDCGCIDDRIRSPKRTHEDSGLHEWQQAEFAFRYVIDKLTEKGEVVCDPFTGSGTCMRACKRIGRQFVGAEINEGDCATANESIKNGVFNDGQNTL